MSAPKAPPVVVELAYVDPNRPGYAFVKMPRPTLQSLYILTHICVTRVRCPRCASDVGEPCSGKGGYKAETHVARRKSFRDVVLKARKA